MSSKEYQRNYAIENSAKKKEMTKEWYRRVRRSCLEILGGKCVSCGFLDYRALQVDHINGGGFRDKKSMTKVYFKAVIESFLKNENKYQLLCANCNWIKRFTKNEVRKPK